MAQTQPNAPLPAFTQYECLSASHGVLLERFRRREMVHAYLLTGARGLGKRTFAMMLAGALFCMSAPKPCGHCAACKSFFSGNNPDLITLFADDGKQIGVDQARAVTEAVSQHAFGSGFRVVMIEPVEKMTPQAQNCLLKSLEEPVANVVFLLMTHELNATLGTIASRCVRVKLTPWPDDAMNKTLVRLGYAPDTINGVLPRCGGNIGAALEMLSENTADSEAQSIARDALNASTDAAIVGLSTKLKDSKGSAERCLNALEQLIHQALLVRTDRLPSSALSAYPPIWQKAARLAPVSDFNELLCAVFETRKLRAGQVNWQSSLDHLMMKLLEERQKWQQL